MSAQRVVVVHSPTCIAAWRDAVSLAVSTVVPCLLLCVGVARAANAVDPSFPQAKISAAQWQAYFSAVEAIPDIRCADREPLQYACDSKNRRTIWTFTRRGHAAHPAVSRGVLIIDQVLGRTVLGIDRSGHYAGDLDAFNKWMLEFKALDERQVAEWHLMPSP